MLKTVTHPLGSPPCVHAIVHCFSPTFAVVLSHRINQQLQGSILASLSSCVKMALSRKWLEPKWLTGVMPKKIPRTRIVGHHFSWQQQWRHRHPNREQRTQAAPSRARCPSRSSLLLAVLEVNKGFFTAIHGARPTVARTSCNTSAYDMAIYPRPDGPTCDLLGVRERTFRENELELREIKEELAFDTPTVRCHCGTMKLPRVNTRDQRGTSGRKPRKENALEDAPERGGPAISVTRRFAEIRLQTKNVVVNKFPPRASREATDKFTRSKHSPEETFRLFQPQA